MARHLTTIASALALTLSAGHAFAQDSGVGSRPNPTHPAEMSRGMPGVDIDLRANGKAETNGMPGVDVDLRGTPRADANRPAGNADLQASGQADAQRQGRMSDGMSTSAMGASANTGAGAGMGTPPARADRN